jgi:hypothetical protein
MDSASVTAIGFHESMDLDPIWFAIFVSGGHNIEETERTEKRLKDAYGAFKPIGERSNLIPASCHSTPLFCGHP